MISFHSVAALYAIANLPFTLSYCPAPGPLLAPPTISSHNFSIRDSAFQNHDFQATTSFAVKAFIGDAEIFGHEYSAPGYEKPQTLYDTKIRIASTTKVFTVLAVLLSCGKIGWEDPITKYIPELDSSKYSEVAISALASQTSGVGFYGYVGDLAIVPGFNASLFGLPAINNTHPGCDTFPGQRVCSREQSIAMFNDDAYRPYSPNSGPLYSNIAYNLLGMALASVHGKTYEEVIQELIFDPLGMNSSQFESPTDDEAAVLPKASDAWFAADFGNYNPTGGIWTTPKGMVLFGNAIRKNTLLSKAQNRKWLQPRAFLPASNQLVGAPWETFRPTDLDLTFPRPIEIYTKSGSVNGYASRLVLIPEYDIMVTIHAAGNDAVPAELTLFSTVIKPLVEYADRMARIDAATRYAGLYHSADGHSSLTIALNEAGPGLHITALNVNGVPVLQSFSALLKTPINNLDVGLYPTDPDSLGSRSETWRLLFDLKVREKQFGSMECISWMDGDTYRYVKEPLDMVAFEIEDDAVIAVVLAGWRVKLIKERASKRGVEARNAHM